ncbi:MAG: DUF4214 domain-containing protein [Lachnospiraceae bacterium]|nr:DUF4214 domain-containing protein [Lachnospiraceae bacterium]MDY3747105.1 DUF4214 domain-containing protein [Lachnospiraceae bacterium]
MRKYFKRVASMMLALAMSIVMAFAVPGIQSHAEKSYNEVEYFVKRMYQVCLSRQPDKAGLNDWTNKLKTRQITGADCTYGFFFSNEFQAMNLCDECFIRSLYHVYLDRNPDAQGMANWKEALADGATRGSLLTGFIESAEFTSICEFYEIRRGDGRWNDKKTVITGNCVKCGTENKTVTDFVTRLYNVCLGRNPDQEGVNDWVGKLKEGMSGADIAYGFIFSREFQEKSLCNNDFVEYMYNAFFDRGSDPTGKADWTGKLNDGATKGTIFSGFVGSQEFLKLCTRYGISAGAKDYSASDYKSVADCKACGSQTAEEHVHTWIDDVKTVHHEEEGHYETVVVEEAYDEPVYEGHYICNVCGIDITASGELLGIHCIGCGSGYHVDDVQIDTIHHDAVTEQKWIVDKGAYDEQIPDGQICTGCGQKK